MNLNSWLKDSSRRLEAAGITTARLDCLVLIGDALEKDKAWILSHTDHALQRSDVIMLNNKVAQRVKHIPLAYIRGKVEFYGREFLVTSHTLVPRPETETMIQLLHNVMNREAAILSWQDGGPLTGIHRPPRQSKKTSKTSALIHTNGGYKVVWEKVSRKFSHTKYANPPLQRLARHDNDFCIIDIGSGSGAIAITAKLQFPDACVIATDIDKSCLSAARKNAQKLKADIEFLRGNLLQPFEKRPTTNQKQLILLCNLPYVPDDFAINTAATHEPKHALFGGPDGLDLYRQLFKQIAEGRLKPQHILTESMPPQHAALAEIAASTGYNLLKTDDFIQVFTTDNCLLVTATNSPPEHYPALPK